jgi:hypothetical protein
MSESIREVLAREAADAEARAEAEERGEVAPTHGQRGRKHAADPSQVYAVRIPLSKLRKLRELAEQLDTPPTALIRQWVIERLDAAEADAAADSGDGENGAGTTEEISVGGLKLGPRRQRARSRVAEPCGGRVRRHA